MSAAGAGWSGVARSSAVASASGLAGVEVGPSVAPPASSSPTSAPEGAPPPGVTPVVSAGSPVISPWPIWPVLPARGWPTRCCTGPVPVVSIGAEVLGRSGVPPVKPMSGGCGATPSGRGTAPFVSTVLVPSESRVTVVPGPAGAGASVPGSFSGTVMVVWAFAAIPRDRAATAVSVTFLRDIRASPYSAGVVRRS